MKDQTLFNELPEYKDRHPFGNRFAEYIREAGPSGQNRDEPHRQFSRSHARRRGCHSFNEKQILRHYEHEVK